MRKKTEVSEKFTYEEAWKELQEIEEAIAAQQVPIEKLSEVIARAKLLLDFCQTRLRVAEDSVNKLFDEDTQKNDATSKD